MKKYIYIISLFFLVSCNENLDMVGMFSGQSPRNDQRFEDSMKYNEKAGYQTITIPQDDYIVYFGTDMHVDSTWRNTQEWATRIENDKDCYFGIILGDMINAQHNFPNFMKGVSYTTKPLFATAGNHDLYFGQWTEYLQYWHTSTYYFTAQTPNYKDLYICMDSGDGTFGRSQMAWLKDILKEKSQDNFRHIVVFTHTHLYKRDSSQGHISNFPLEETYEIADVLGTNGVDWYVSGHAHSRAVSDMKGVKYIIVDTMKDPAKHPAYMTATVGANLDYHFIDL